MAKRNVFITGSTGNLGMIVSKAFVEAGYHVIGTVESTSGHETHDMENIEYHGVDLSKEDKVAALFTKLKERYTSLHAAICLAGGFSMSNLASTSYQELEHMFNLNFITAFNTAKHAYSWMKESGFGRIVMIGAKPAIEGGASEVLPYAISKGAVIQLASVLNETGRKDGIVTSVVIPSIIDTPANQEAMPDANFADWVSPEDIAGNILHLVSNEAKSLRSPVLKMYGNS